MHYVLLEVAGVLPGVRDASALVAPPALRNPRLRDSSNFRHLTAVGAEIAARPDSGLNDTDR